MRVYYTELRPTIHYCVVEKAQCMMCAFYVLHYVCTKIIIA